jgi:hypothetical protein
MKNYNINILLLFLFYLSISTLFSIPIKIAEINIGTFDFEIENNIMYTAYNGLNVYDISNPHMPTELSEFSFEYGAEYTESKKITLNSDKAYVINILYDYEYYIIGAKLAIIDISDPYNLILVGNQNISTSSKSIAIENGYAYIVYDNGFRVYNISNPNLIELVNTTEVNNAQSITINNDIGCISCKQDGLKIFDFNNPIEPALISEFTNDEDMNYTYFENSIAYVCNGENGTVIIDLTDLENPILISQCNSPENSRHCVAQNNKLFITEWNHGVQIFDITDLHSPFFLSDFEPCSSSRSCTPINDITILGGSYINIIDISDLSNPSFESHFDIENEEFRKLKFHQDRAHVYMNSNLYYNYRIQMIDFSNISDPITLGSYAPFPVMNAYEVSANFTYVVWGGSGLYIYQITNPNNPFLLSVTNSGSWNTGLVRIDDIAYMTTHDVINVIDLSDLSFPSIVNTINFGWSNIENIYCYSNHLFVTDFFNGISIFNLENPYSPELISIIDPEGAVENINFVNNYMYASASSILHVINISNMSLPIISNTISIPYSRIIFIDDVFYVIDPHWNRIHIYNISDNENPVWEGYLNYNYQVNSIEKVQDYILFMTENNGFYFYDELWETVAINGEEIKPLGNDISLLNYPNPFNPETTISYQLPADNNVSLSIYNIKGQKVKTLVNALLPAGEHSAIWDGRDSNDNRVSSGIYFYQLNINGKTKALRKMLLLK